MKHCVIIGGGIIGLSTAYYLLQEGCKVTVIDKFNMSEGASYVNAGYITPSHIIPLAAPGMVAKGFKWMFDSSSPFYIKPRLHPDFLKWGWYFNRSATHKNVQKSIPIIKDINLLSKELYQELYDSGNLGTFQLEKNGILMLYVTDKAGEEEKEVALRAVQEGLEVNFLDKKETQQIEPTISSQVKGAILYKCDAHTTPNEVMPKLISYLKTKGVSFKTQEEVVSFVTENKSITAIQTQKDIYKADEFIIASGSWTRAIAKKLQLAIPIEAGKGYRINVERPTGIKLPAILLERKIAITPMSGFTRFAGTMELSGINNIIRKERVNAIANGARQYYKDLSFTQEELEDAQCGLRPVSPDGLPYIGRPEHYNNVTIAAGHAMMGWSLGPATGKLITEIITNKKTSIDITPFKIGRKF